MSAIKGLLIDLSGTIHIDSKVIPGAIQAIERLKASNIPFRFILWTVLIVISTYILCRFATNTTKVSSRQLVNKLNKLGFQIEEKDVVIQQLKIKVYSLLLGFYFLICLSRYDSI